MLGRRRAAMVAMGSNIDSAELVRRVPAMLRLDRAAAPIAALLVQALLLGLLVTRHAHPVEQGGVEAIVELPPLAPPPAAPPAASLRARLHRPAAELTLRLKLNRPAPNRAPGIMSLHGALFGCMPDDIHNAEDRRRCGGGLLGTIRPNDTARLMSPQERSAAAAMWSRDVARKQQPPLLPCGGGLPLSLGAVICLKNGLTEGFDLREQPGYMDRPTEEYLPNGGKPIPPRQPYRDN